MNLAKTWVAMAMLTIASCSKHEPMSREDAIDLAADYATERFPESQKGVLQPVIEDHNNEWVVRYLPPKGYAGGGPVIVIDKSSHKVVRAFAEQ